MARCTVCSKRQAAPRQAMCEACRRGAPRRADVWIAWLTIILAYTFVLAMGVSILFPNLDVHDGWLRALLYAVQLFFLLRAYIAYRSGSTVEVVLFLMVFLIVLAALHLTPRHRGTEMTSSLCLWVSV